MRLIFVTPTDIADPQGGRAMLARLHRDALQALLGDDLREYRVTGTAGMLASLAGQVDGATPAQAEAIVAAIDAHGADALWLDGSNLGHIARAVSRARPNVRIVTFFHNVEARFFWGAMRARRSLKSVAVLAANWLAERMAVRRSDVLVTLSDRDSAGLRRLYGRGADTVAPMVLEDRAPPAPAPAPPHDPAHAPAVSGGYLLFVGGGFYANIAGIRWFAQQVAPRIALPVKVIGRAMDELAGEFAPTDNGTDNAAGNVELIGAVDDLAPWYAGATLVIAPIFDGSGMKTKVAEALMHGKRIAATPEALSGYADDVVAASWCCADADAFVRAVAEAAAAPPLPYDPAMRALYERDHSPAAGAARLARIMAR
ncbi:glycosyltransferase [Sphingomonas albertensis]|uniref:Glycosyltransferase n=1 Tax=Sphingomonas albertensis TaxID=2762591 RepID=A0ABR7ALH2_9SPHN|nr:glycosyltransferase [Sphingomonas albertensis]MBC3941304.1 glycosyltransferase [Sphingomonas albertensis]